YTQGIASGSSTQAGISLFPNPAGETLNIRVDEYRMDIQSIEIVSMTGQVVYQMQINAPGQKEFRIDVADFRNGVYFVKLQDGSETKVGKVIIQ
ncbi:MAG: T9SS type A sorting domain-containing protein, partial [Bacteroidales bacterium]